MEMNDLIDRYLDGLCSAEEMEAFERRCFSDEAFFRQVRQREKFREVVAEVCVEKGETLFAEYLQQETTAEEESSSWLDKWFQAIKRLVSSFSISLQNNRLPAYAAAVMLVIAVTSVIYLNREKPNETLFAAYFQPYPSTIPSPRGKPSEGLMAEAMAKYKAGDYREALKIYQSIVQTEPSYTMAYFYAGISYLAVNVPQQAITSLQKVIADEGSKYQEHAEWYLGLAYLKANALENAKSQLNRIISRHGLYAEQATELLQRLSSSE
jgi:tetratricopeptide (TPR) repeat protein